MTLKKSTLFCGLSNIFHLFILLGTVSQYRLGYTFLLESFKAHKEMNAQNGWMSRVVLYIVKLGFK